MKYLAKRFSLNIDDSRQFLHSIEQQIALFDHRLILPVLAVRSIGLHDSTHSVDFTM